jgi:ribosomal-protein-alanine N-acetyltransferase
MSQNRASPNIEPMGIRKENSTKAKADLSTVMEIEMASFPKFAWKRKASFMKYINRGDAFVVRDADDAVVGYVLFKECESGEIISIEKMAVAVDRRKQGLGRFILDWTCAHARDQCAKQLCLHVRGSNTRALNLYARNGFKVTAIEESGYADNEPVGAEKIKIAMRLFL